MPYNAKQYDAARDFIQKGDDNVVAAQDKLRIEAYNLYEDIYINSTVNLKIVLRGSDQAPMLVPTASKIIESTNRFLALNLDYLVEGQGDAGAQQLLEGWWKDFFKREKVKTKFASFKRWGLIRGDSILMIYGNPNKEPGERISLAEISPKQVFEIEDAEGNCVGVYIVEIVQDFREKNDPSKQVVKRRMYRKEQDADNNFTGKILGEVTFWEIAKWDDRDPNNVLEKVPGGPEEPLLPLPDPIDQIPLYKWNNKPMENTSWGTSQLAGFETLMYGINQSLSDEDATVVFQGLGMYITTAGAPVDPTTGEFTDWNIGPMQIIEIGQDQKFERVTGLTDVSPYQEHMTFMDEKGISEAGGIPSVAIGRVDVSIAQSGIALTLELMPLLASNAEKELLLVGVMDQLFHDITTTWLPVYEPETFGNILQMSEMSVVSIFDDPMPVDRNAVIQETLLLQTSNLILTSMAVSKLRDVGWKYPTVDPDTGEPLTDEDIVQKLLDQAKAAATAIDPFASQATSDLSSFDQATGLPGVPGNVGSTQNQGNTAPDQRQVALSGG